MRFFEPMNGYSSDLHGYSIMTGLRIATFLLP